MRSKLYIIMPVLLLLALLAYPVLQIFYEAEENPYLVEIVETSTNTDKSICRWGLCRGKNGAIPEVARMTSIFCCQEVAYIWVTLTKIKCI